MSTIQLRRATASGNVPSSLAHGELAVQEYDHLLFGENAAGTGVNKYGLNALISKGSFSAAATFDYVFPNITGYKQIRWSFTRLFSTLQTDYLYARVSTNGGSSFITTNSYLYAETYDYSGPSSSWSYGYSGTTATNGMLMMFCPGGDQASMLELTMMINSSGTHTTFFGECACHSTDGYLYNFSYVGCYNGAAVNALRFYPQTGTTRISGNYSVYGLL